MKYSIDPTYTFPRFLTGTRNESSSELISLLWLEYIECDLELALKQFFLFFLWVFLKYFEDESELSDEVVSVLKFLFIYIKKNYIHFNKVK